MKREFYQACYAHTDAGWAIVNISTDVPQALADDFSSAERVNAAMAAGKKVPMGKNETPSCMMEIYCQNDTIGLVRTQYSLSDGQGRPVSFSHGYMIQEAYEFLKEPNDLLRIGKENFADQRMSEKERAEICSVPGMFNRRLIGLSEVERMPDVLSMSTPFSYKTALEECNLSEEAFRTYMMALYVHIISANADKNLYIKTDGSEKYARNILYLTYLALPYSMRVLLSATTYLHIGQHNAKLMFCYELPENVPQIDPITGVNNVMNETVEKRTRERYPFIMASLDYAASGKQNYFFDQIEACLQLMGDKKLNTMSVMNLAYSMSQKEFEIPERLPGLIYRWLALSVQNTENWEDMLCFLLQKAEECKVNIGEEAEKLLKRRLEGAVTEGFKALAEKYLS